MVAAQRHAAPAAARGGLWPLPIPPSRLSLGLSYIPLLLSSACSANAASESSADSVPPAARPGP